MSSLAIQKADQERINRYSYLIQQRNSLQDKINDSKRERENQNDAQADLEELELLGEDDSAVTATIKVGNAFLHVPPAVAKAHNERLLSKADIETNESQGELERVEKEMQILKNILSSKFGNAIRLE